MKLNEVRTMETVKTLEDVPPGFGVMEIMDRTGDTKKIWDPTKPVEVEDARRTFNDLKKKGYAAFQVRDDDDGTAGEQMRDFDPNAGRMIMRPPMQGG
jgi:folate-dependent tRNA-U54 methylase TrmFO/GidA